MLRDSHGGGMFVACRWRNRNVWGGGGYFLGNPIFETGFSVLCGLYSREVVRNFERRLGQEKKREYTHYSIINVRRN